MAKAATVRRRKWNAALLAAERASSWGAASLRRGRAASVTTPDQRMRRFRRPTVRREARCRTVCGMHTCPACGQENPDSSRFCGMCGAALVPAAAPPARGAEGRDDPLHRPRRLDGARRRARPGGRPRDALRLLRAAPRRARAARRHRREVHRRRRDGRLRRAGRARGRRRARGAGGARDPRLDRRRAADPHRRQHRRGARRARSEARRGRRDGGGRRRQHGRAAAGRGAGQRDPRRRRDVPRHPARDRLPRRAGGRGEGQGRAGQGVGGGRRPLALRQRRRGEAADAARRPGARARPPRRRSDAGAHGAVGAARHARRRPRNRQEPPRRRAVPDRSRPTPTSSPGARAAPSPTASA